MATTSKGTDKRCSKFHPQRGCSECILCGKSSAQYSHYEMWSDAERDFLRTHWGSEPDGSSCICIAHQKEAKRTHPIGYSPKWSKVTTIEQVSTIEDEKQCMHPSCSSTGKLSTPSFAPVNELKAALHITIDAQEILVCQYHYQQLYRHFNTTSRPCSSCGIKPPKGKSFSRHCPNFSLINAVLHMDGDSEEITPTDNICLNCYKSHLLIITFHEHSKQLGEMIEIWEHTVSDTTDELTKAILRSVLYVAHELGHERAVLLPQVSRVFLREYSPDINPNFQEQILESTEGSVKFTSRWLLKHLLVHLHSYMDYKCIHKKFGTVLFRRGGDLLTSLSWALGITQVDTSVNLNYEHCVTKVKDPNYGKILGEAGDIVNDLLHAEMAKASLRDVKELVGLNIDEEVNNMDPLLWLFLESATRTVKQRQSTTSEENCHIKRLRRYFIFCLLSYCSNTQRPTLLHTLLADTIEVCGGSRKLIKILNQFGAVCSPDTHDRFVTDVACTERQKTVWDHFPMDTLTLASADNFDSLKSHAAVYCGDQQRSYHGTTVQVMQPNPAIRMHGQTLSLATALKRNLGCSPTNSPHKLGKVGPKRPRTLVVRNLTEQLSAVHDSNTSPPSNEVMLSPQSVTMLSPQSVTMQGFTEQLNEKQERESLESKILAYMTIKASSQGDSSRLLHEFKDLYAYCTQGCVNKSNIYYMEMINENPDSSDTMKHVSELLLSTANPNQDGYVILIGDGKTYQHLMGIKRTYGPSLKKLLIFPGDWHTLFNFQPVLLKIYYHAGLKELAQASGFRGETLTSLEKCSNFKRTHQFLLQVWQAMYRALITVFNAANPDIPEVVPDKDSTLRDILKDTEFLVNDSGRGQAFKAWVSAMSDADDTFKFWCQYVFKDCLAYIQLHLAIRCQNWQLRVSALKLMAPLFSAYDRTTYQRLIPHHLADLQKFPAHILDSLKQGFTVSINGGKGHAIAIDEAHEMCVNKDTKVIISQVTEATLQKTTLTLQYRITAHKNLLHQIFPHLNCTESLLFDVYTSNSAIKKREENITAMLTEIQGKGLFFSPTANRGLINIFSGVMASPEQCHDLLNFRKIGSNDLENYISHYLLKKPSTNAPVRKNKLLTMATPKKVSKRLLSQKDKELKQVNKCLRQRLAWCNRTGQSYDTSNEQYSQYPRAICDENGLPQKGTKSVWKDKLKKRYPGPNMQVVFDMLPSQWIPDAVILDGMFLINCKPLRTTATIKDYGLFMFDTFLRPHYQANVKEVHLLFDTPGLSSGLGFNPKVFEQTRRDQSKALQCHKHQSFTPMTPLPPLLKNLTAWRNYIDCRQCKRSLIEAIGLSYLQSIRHKLQPDQTFYLSGCFPQDSTFRMSGSGSLPEPDVRYKSNAEEVDMRCWRHTAVTSAQRILIYSPDTDIYNIGLSILAEIPSKDVIVQLNVPKSQVQLYLHLNILVQALECDPDLASLPKPELPKIFQMLFITSGCDYVSYFAGQGKAAFFNAFFQHSAFITGKQMSGLLSDFTEDKKDLGFLALLRLVGTLYFKKYYSAVVSLKGVETPQQLFNSFTETDPSQKHQLWYNQIRAIVGERISDERDRMPSHTSLWRHWLRSCWVAQMWGNSAEEDLQQSLPSPEVCGWMKNTDGSYGIDWECPKVQHGVQETINFLTKGCSCKKGCASRRCGCVSKGKNCGPGCLCNNCVNVATSSPSDLVSHSMSSSNIEDVPSESDDDFDSDSSASDSENDSEQGNVETEIISDMYDEQNNYSIDF